MKNLLIVLALVFVGFACSNEAANTQDENTEDTTTPTEEVTETEEVQSDGIHFGETITDADASEVSTILTLLQTIDTVKTKVYGTVTSVCQKKGCWMTLSDGTEGSEELFVRFKDYGFFVPMDIEGRSLVMDGVAYKEVTTVEELRHYAEDAGKSAEEIAEITEPEERWRYEAIGVMLLAGEE